MLIGQGRRPDQEEYSERVAIACMAWIVGSLSVIVLMGFFIECLEMILR